ncbi:MAG: hypothetical protein IKH37_06235 [Prevotella sp.]|nr:hypothetical protein [Prevotella sp.]
MRKKVLLNKKLFLLTMLVFAFSLSVNAKKPKPVFKYQLNVTSKTSERGNLIIFSAEAKDWDVSWINDFTVKNNTDERIFIEWENARVTNSRVIFGDDRRISMGNPKADEAVSAHGSSISREITGETYIGSNYVLPLFRPKKLKKNIGSKDYVFFMIPIRYGDNTVEEFELELTVWYELPPTTE